MKTLLIGISSPIGQSFLKAANSRGLNLIAISELSNNPSLIRHHSAQIIECDLGDQQKLQELLFEEWPDVLINCLEETIDDGKMVSSNTHLPKFLSKLTHHLGT